MPPPRDACLQEEERAANGPGFADAVRCSSFATHASSAGNDNCAVYVVPAAIVAGSVNFSTGA